jgi:hypothetical protein
VDEVSVAGEVDGGAVEDDFGGVWAAIPMAFVASVDAVSPLPSMRSVVPS